MSRVYLDKVKRIFQSHFGLILSVVVLWMCYLELCLSIPFWSDFIRFRLRSIFWVNVVHLSIPFWSDFIGWLSKRLTGCGSFQSHFGLILSVIEMISKEEAIPAFNPILVWFYQNMDDKWRKYFEKLSIPFWSDFIGSTGMYSISSLHTFQSHFGLILSSSDFSAAHKGRFTFNPILVWFYLTLPYLSKPA